MRYTTHIRVVRRQRVNSIINHVLLKIYILQNFEVLLTVHLSIILAIKQINAQNLL